MTAFGLLKFAFGLLGFAFGLLKFAFGLLGLANCPFILAFICLSLR